MYKHVVQKSLGLLLFYAIVIVGIFVVQFRSDSIIQEKLGSLRLTLSEVKDESGTSYLKNTVRISFNGFTVNANADEPIVAHLKDKTEKNLSLVSYEKKNLSYNLHFTEDVLISFSVSDESDKAHLQIVSTFPETVSSLSIPYSLSSSANVLAQTETALQLDMRRSQWELQAASIADETLLLNSGHPFVSYSFFDAKRKFSFDTASALALADSTLYAQMIANLKQNLISAFQTQSASGVSEQEAVSFVAAMAQDEKYNEALDAVPDSFKKGNARTFLSSPFFGSLSQNVSSLKNTLALYRDSVSENSLHAFEHAGLADYLCMYPEAPMVLAILQTANKVQKETLSLSDAVNILLLYDNLVLKNSELANTISQASEVCVEKIASACQIENAKITISENGVFLSAIDACKAGDALLRYGKATANTTKEKTGYALVNSYAGESASFDLETLATLYALLVHDNSFYPHFTFMGFDAGEALWAWTSAKNISFEKTNANEVSFLINFPNSWTHYVYVHGVRNFKTIFIYDMAFRSDPRFETYNSSGYVYRSDDKLLLLKSRHKQQIEKLKLVYQTAQAPSPAIETEATTTETEPPAESETQEPAEPTEE